MRVKEAMEQAWSINSSTAVLNSETLMIVANMLKTYPELHCKLHGSTDADRGDADKNEALAAYFKLESTQSIQDELAQKRAKVCKEKLVELGVPGERLLVTWASCGKHSKVDFFPMELAEAMAEKAVWKAKAAEAVNIFKDTVNDPISETEQTVDRLRAKTMDGLVEEFNVSGAYKRVLFLTNKQAEVVQEETAAIARLLKELQGPTGINPELVINLLSSPGTIADTRSSRNNLDSVEDGRARGEHPWASHEKAQLAERKLDDFMMRVIIPTASTSKAIVFCDGMKGRCFLSDSFNRMMELQTRDRADKAHITIIAVSCGVDMLYRNRENTAHWRDLRDNVPNWKRNDKSCFKEEMINGDGNIKGRSYYNGNADLDPRATNHIVVDGIDRIREKPMQDVKPTNNLMMAMIRHLTKSSATAGVGLPCLQLKTGFSERPTLSQQNLADSSSSLAFAIACHRSSGPKGHLIFIDLRHREEERVEKDKRDKDEKNAQARDRTKQAEENSQARFEKIEKGIVRRLLTKWCKAVKVQFKLLMSGQVAIKERERARSQKSDPAELIQKVKNMWVQHCNTITSKELGEDKGNEDRRLLREGIRELVLETGSRACDIFDVCAVSFFRNELHPRFLDDSSSTRELTFSPLYEALQEATKLGSRDGRSQDAHAKNNVQEKFSQQLNKAELAAAARPLPTEQQYLELSWWLAKRFVEQAFEVVYYHHRNLLHDFELELELDQQQPKSERKKALKTAWVEHNIDSKVSPMCTHLNILFGLDEQYFHACNVNNVQQAKRLVAKILTNAGDRLPKVTQKEGLQLLQMAWKEYDVAVYHGAWYSWLARIFQGILLLCSVVIIFFTVLYTQRCNDDEDAILTEDEKYVADIASSLNISIFDADIDDCLQISIDDSLILGTIFSLSLAMTFVKSLDAYIIPSSRALHLKLGAAELESIIWLYRTGHENYNQVNDLHEMLKILREKVSTSASLSETYLKKEYPVSVYKHYQKNYALERKPKRWVLKGPGPDKKLEKGRKQADEARGKVIRMQSMLNRIERFELGEADFHDESRDFLRDKDIFVDSEDRYLFKKACPVEFDRIERRERVDKQEEEKKLARETAARLMEKLDVKLKAIGGPVMQNSSSTSSSVSLSASTVATGTKTGAVDSEAKQQLMRALDDRKTYMVEALQMEIALMVNQHRIVDDYQSPVNGSMYIKLRIEPEISLCKKQIPRFAKAKHVLFLLILCCTLTSAALSFFKYVEWVAVITAFATAVTSWFDFNGYVQKLDSCDSAVRKLESHLSWWQSLSDSERAGTPATDKLVEGGEQFILATRFSRSLTLPEKKAKKKVEDVGADGAASGSATTTDGTASGKATTTEGTASGKATTTEGTASGLGHSHRPRGSN